LANETYEQEAKRLAALPRAQRFEELIEFPTKHMFKIIGKRGEIGADVQATLTSLGFPPVLPIERHSAKGRYVSITLELNVESGEQLDAIYTALEQLEGVKYLF
jgi:putative lipoic acid-binding regulatory protein